MAIQVSQVRQDQVELIYNPKETDLSVGDSLIIRERDGERGLVVQVIEFRSATYPTLSQELLRLALEEGEISPQLIFLLAEKPELRNLNIAIAKVRRLLHPSSRWEAWNGWIPTRDVVVERVSHRVVMDSCIPQLFHPVTIGSTAHGEPFTIDGRSLEKVNVIVGAKGTGKSHLSKVLLLELIAQGAPCIVFDLNREYIHLPPHEPGRPGIIPLQAGVDLKLDVHQFGLDPLLTLLRRFGLPETSAMYFRNRLSGILEGMDRMRAMGKNPPFIGIRELIQLADEGEYAPSEIVNLAIRARLELIRKTGLLAASPQEATPFSEQYERLSEGGGLVIDISDLSNPVRYAFVQAMVEIVRAICEQEIRHGTNRFPFIFFEEAHLYLPANTIGSLVSRARHLGLTTFFITNMISGLDETVLRQMDNLFALRLPFEEDVRYLGKCALVDQDTLTAFVGRLRDFHALVIGNVTNRYPIIIRVKELRGIRTAGETRYFFRAPRRPSVVPLPL